MSANTGQEATQLLIDGACMQCVPCGQQSSTRWLLGAGVRLYLERDIELGVEMGR